jgi:hypothetical protein
MDHKNEAARFALDTITNIMDFQEDDLGNKIWWAFCFGNMLEYIADKTFSLDYDIDVGVIYGQCDEEKLISAFTGYGYKAEKKCINDRSKKAFNIHFIPGEDCLKGLPTIDVYFWVLIGDKYYHTYDTKKEGSVIPSEYVFKGVKKQWLIPDKNILDVEKKIGKPGREQLLTDVGTWRFPVFDGMSGLTIRIPYAVGHLLDTWYSKTWRFREHYRGQSMSPWVIKVRSCKELK